VSAAEARGRAGLSWLTVRIAAEVVILAAGAAVVLALAAIFVEILDAVTDADDLTALDRAVSDWLIDHRTPWLTHIEIAITNLGSAAALTTMVSLVGIVTAIRLRSWYPIVLAVVGLGGSQLLVAVIKAAIARPRPNPPGQLVPASGFSFPSGHSASSMVGFGLLAWLACLLTANRTIWATAWLAAALGTTSVGASRVYLGVHYPTDVLGGWALGLTWLAVVALAAQVWRMRA
jgi:undecaprenyl-diphosphatase